MTAVVDNQTLLERGAVESVVWWTLEEAGVNDSDIAVRVSATLRPKHAGHFYAQARYSSEHEDLWSASGDFAYTEAEHLILCEIPYVPVGKWVPKGKSGEVPAIEPRTWRESLVCITAHEARHYVQWLNDESFNELDCEWSERRALDHWRERKPL
jgi:hypothetical protein